jgi:hypothetical protein
MNWSTGVGASIGLVVRDTEPIVLRMSRNGEAYMAIGDSVEIILARSHVAALTAQSATVLGDMTALDTAEEQMITAQIVGERAATTAEYAKAQADAAMAVGATREAQDARAAADKAADASATAHAAVSVALDAIQTAEDSMEAAGEAAAAAARVVSASAADDMPPGHSCTDTGRKPCTPSSSARSWTTT